jgi:phosphate starvation-inducible protein PhoH and related proteins
VVQDILEGVPDIHFARLTSQDVVRHRLVGEIVDAYERYDAQQQKNAAPRGSARGGGKRGQ